MTDFKTGWVMFADRFEFVQVHETAPGNFRRGEVFVLYKYFSSWALSAKWHRVEAPGDVRTVDEARAWALGVIGGWLREDVAQAQRALAEFERFVAGGGA